MKAKDSIDIENPREPFVPPIYTTSRGRGHRPRDDFDMTAIQLADEEGKTLNGSHLPSSAYLEIKFFSFETFDYFLLKSTK